MSTTPPRLFKTNGFPVSITNLENTTLGLALAAKLGKLARAARGDRKQNLALQK
jgi:hypothetical protein